ncbi:unnamed protein product, partial [Musa banksii]
SDRHRWIACSFSSWGFLSSSSSPTSSISSRPHRPRLLLSLPLASTTPPSSPPPPPPPTPLLSLPSPNRRFPHHAAGTGFKFISAGSVLYSIFVRNMGSAMTMKKMLETSFPGIDVILSNYPPAFPKRVLGKVVPVLQIGVIAIITAGDQIFPRLGMAPPPWYFSLRANRFGAIASTWLFGNFLQSTLQSSGAFEVYCDGELV